jgi:hypothetical protein
VRLSISLGLLLPVFANGMGPLPTPSNPKQVIYECKAWFTDFPKKPISTKILSFTRDISNVSKSQVMQEFIPLNNDFATENMLNSDCDFQLRTNFKASPLAIN